MFFCRIHFYHGRAEPKYDAMLCCPWWPCLPCGTAIMYSFLLVGLVLLSTVSLLAGILCCLPWSETQLNQEMKAFETSQITLHKCCCCFAPPSRAMLPCQGMLLQLFLVLGLLPLLLENRSLPKVYLPLLLGAAPQCTKTKSQCRVHAGFRTEAQSEAQESLCGLCGQLTGWDEVDLQPCLVHLNSWIWRIFF